jgi:hypothetical protein
MPKHGKPAHLPPPKVALCFDKLTVTISPIRIKKIGENAL